MGTCPNCGGHLTAGHRRRARFRHVVRTAADVGLAVAVGGALGGATIGKLGALITGSSFAVARGVAGSAAALVLLRAIGPR